VAGDGRFLDRLQLLAEAGGGKGAAVEGHIAIRAALLPWQHRDPFDRLIAATAIALKTPLVSSDTAFDMLSGEADWLGRIW
jgi:PIN domain nuclease of toxin-antitoxin system